MKNKVLFTIMFAGLFLGSIKAQTVNFVTRYSGTQTGVVVHFDGSAYYLKDERSDRAKIHVQDMRTYPASELTEQDYTVINGVTWDKKFNDTDNKDIGLDVFWALQQIRDYLFDVHGINGYDNDNLNPAKPYS